jgi:plastocyanin
MRRIALAVALALAQAATARGGDDATGTVRGAVSVLKRSLFGTRASDDRSGVVVYVTGYGEPPPKGEIALEQQNEKFVPRVLPIVAGQTVVFPNRDRLYHNVFSVSPITTFDLGQYKSSDPPRTQSFPTPGLVPVYCNIHPDMISYVVVLENRAFAVTGEDGRFELHGVRPGKLALNAWLPGAQRVTREIELAPGAALAVDLELAQTQTIPPHLRKDGTPYPPSSDYEPN